MSPLFTVIVIILAVLAIIDLIVGVSNDAINFLNSALGSKVAKRCRRHPAWSAHVKRHDGSGAQRRVSPRDVHF